MRTEPPPSSQPLSTMSYCIALARPAGSDGARRSRSPDVGHKQALVLRQHAAERIVGGVPALVLGVPLVHREAVDPAVGEHVRVGQAEAVGELDAQPAEDVGHDRRGVRDDQDEVALSASRPLDERALCVVPEELDDGALQLAICSEREMGEALRAESPGELGQLVHLAP